MSFPRAWTRIALPPRHSSSVTRDFQSSISVEALFHRCHLDVQGLLYQQLLSSAMVQYSGLLPVDWVVVLPHMLRYIRLLHHPPLADIFLFLQSRLQPSTVSEEVERGLVFDSICSTRAFDSLRGVWTGVMYIVFAWTVIVEVIVRTPPIFCEKLLMKNSNLLNSSYLILIIRLIMVGIQQPLFELCLWK